MASGTGRRPVMPVHQTPRRIYSFGLWTVMHRGADPFGAPTRAPLGPLEAISGLAKSGAGAFELHAEDLIPPGSSLIQRDRLISEARRWMDDTGMVCAACGADVFSDPVFKDGGLASSEARVRRLAVARYQAAIDVGHALGAPLFNIWGGRDGAEVDASRSPLEALQRLRDGFNELVEYIARQGYEMRLSIEPKPNEPRGDLYLATVGHALAFIGTLDHPERVGVVPELAHAAMAGLNPAHEVAHALYAGKLFGIHLNAQRPLRFDQDLRFGAANLKDSFFVVKLLEDAGWPGPRSFDAHPYRTTDEREVWEFVRGCIRAYEILAEKVRRFHEDREVQQLLEEIRRWDEDAEGDGSASPPGGAHRSFLYERLDHLVFEILMGTR
ncbi:MAG: TIM barrel protein [Armatimonadota bacterium]|nr:TIM barrel protein [Armatimonadota bacterium]MDR7465090.1 TIM barrel protein [Armatimonadota bacterium]MDR7470661.1 TIM barrel protein [Armatimonadota bacterium]MDR7475294.1 TIM barrel protein [Armatimonadota bacterium]MDR7539913.1 TIM barrel protein [Armatimonadota bacterium]